MPSKTQLPETGKQLCTENSDVVDHHKPLVDPGREKITLRSCFPLRHVVTEESLNYLSFWLEHRVYESDVSKIFIIDDLRLDAAALRQSNSN